MIHIVQKGDTLYKIAQQYYGDGTRYPEIAVANNIDDVNMIHEWDMLEIPGVEETKSGPKFSVPATTPAPSTVATDKSALTKQIVTVVLVVGGIVLAYYLWQNSQSMNVSTNPEEDEEDEDESEDDSEEETE